jgi:hypothetical protein
MLITFPSPPKVKQRWKLYTSGYFPMFPRILGYWRWCEDHVYKFDSRCLNTVFFYFPVTYCSPPFWFKGSVFESDHRQTILLAKTYFGIVFVSQSIPVPYKKYEKLCSSSKGCFQDLASLVRCPEFLSFNHGSYSSRHGLSITRRFHISLEKLIKQFRIDGWFIIAQKYLHHCSISFPGSISPLFFFRRTLKCN